MSATHAVSPHGHDGHGQHDHSHDVSKFQIYVQIAMLLAIITGIEIVGVYLPFAKWIIVTGLVVLSFVKFMFVIFYFMHLRWDSPFNAICLIAALFFVCIFIGIAVLDSREYKVNYNPPGGGQVMNTQTAH
jgi:cytochrome c oxidase subunit 4